MDITRNFYQQVFVETVQACCRRGNGIEEGSGSGIIREANRSPYFCCVPGFLPPRNFASQTAPQSSRAHASIGFGTTLGYPNARLAHVLLEIPLQIQRIL
jgi:hypothetical protein